MNYRNKDYLKAPHVGLSYQHALHIENTCIRTFRENGWNLDNRTR